MRDADTLEEGERNRGWRIERDGRVEEELRVIVHHVSVSHHCRSVDRESNVEGFKKRQGKERVKRAVLIGVAEDVPEREHERLSLIQSHIDAASRAIARGDWKGHRSE